MTRAETLWRMADWARRKAEEAAASDAPWAIRNLRDYQNLMVRWETEASKLEDVK